MDTPPPRHRWLRVAVEKGLREEFAKLQAGRWMPLYTPQGKERTALLGKLKVVFRRLRHALPSILEEAENELSTQARELFAKVYEHLGVVTSSSNGGFVSSRAGRAQTWHFLSEQLPMRFNLLL